MRPPSPSPPHHLSTINHQLSDSRPQINLAKNPPSCSYNPMQSGDTILHRLHLWNFRLDIGLPNIRSKLPENAVNIKIAGQTDLLINGCVYEDRFSSPGRVSAKLALCFGAPVGGFSVERVR